MRLPEEALPGGGRREGGAIQGGRVAVSFHPIDPGYERLKGQALVYGVVRRP